MDKPFRLAAPDSGTPARLAVGLLAAFTIIKLLAHFLTVCITPYGIHRDEFLYLAMGEHLRFWCMDFPPAIAVLAKVARALFGDTLFAVRFFPAVAGTLLLILTALITRELGGGRAAQFLALLTVLLAPLFLRPAVLFQPLVWDQLWWTVGFLALIKIAQCQPRRSRSLDWAAAGEAQTTRREIGDRQEDCPAARWWLVLGAAGGLGLLTKFSIGFFATGALFALWLSTQRGALKTRWPYLAALLALVLGSPSLVGQVRLDFPVMIYMRDLQSQQLQRITASEFLGGQVMMLGPAVLLAATGLLFLLAARSMRQYRLIGWTCVISFLILLLLHGKAYYIGPIYPCLFAAGAVALAKLSGLLGHLLRIGLIALLASLGAIGLPFGLPILPPATMAKYAEAIGIKGAVTTNRGTKLALPQDYADMLGWEEQTAAASQACETLPPEKRAQAVLLARNYGEAGALEFFGPRYGLPRRVLLPGNDRLWPLPAGNPCEVVITVGIPPSDVGRFYRAVRLVTRFDDPWRVEEERNLPICIGEDRFRNLAEAWTRNDR